MPHLRRIKHTHTHCCGDPETFSVIYLCAITPHRQSCQVGIIITGRIFKFLIIYIYMCVCLETSFRMNDDLKWAKNQIMIKMNKLVYKNT